MPHRQGSTPSGYVQSRHSRATLVIALPAHIAYAELVSTIIARAIAVSSKKGGNAIALSCFLVMVCISFNVDTAVDGSCVGAGSCRSANEVSKPHLVIKSIVQRGIDKPIMH